MRNCSKTIVAAKARKDSWQKKGKCRLKVNRLFNHCLINKAWIC